MRDDVVVPGAPWSLLNRMASMRLLRRSAAALLLVGIAGCEAATEPPPIRLELARPIAGATIRALPLEVTGTVAGSEGATLSYTINGGPAVPASVVRRADGAFSFEIADLPAGDVTVGVRAVDGRRDASASIAFVHAPVTLTVTPGAGGMRYGAVMPFTGTVSDRNLVVRYSLNGAAEQAVEQFPGGPPSTQPGPYRAEAHPLRTGTNAIVVRAYAGDTVLAAQAFTVEAEIPQRTYDVRLVTELPEGAFIMPPRLGNDGRVAGSWDTGPGTAFVFTWRDGVLTHLSEMGQVADVNNVGQVLGYKAQSTGSAQSLIWRDGAYTPVAGPASASLINDHGHLANSNRPGIWRDGQFTAYAQGGTFDIRDMNNHGAMIATELSSRSVVAWLDPPALQSIPLGYARAFAERIGDGGHLLVRGQSFSLGFRSVLVHEGVATDLNAIVGWRFDAGGVNASGTVAGVYTHGSEARLAIWKNGRTTDVMLDPKWTPISVYGITDAGQILVLAQQKVGTRKAFLLLTPAP